MDAVIAELEGLLEPGDVLIDGGNSHYTDTERRGESLAAKGVHFLGVGISGGESGARTGPSIMPGGPREPTRRCAPIRGHRRPRWTGSPACRTWGQAAPGHYVKMVHNGIEYGFMQLIADSYALMSRCSVSRTRKWRRSYAEWDKAELASYLVEITAKIFRRRDDKTGGHLVDLIAGEAGQLGTGMWASQSAMDLQVPVPNIDIAVAMRNLSALEDERLEAALARLPRRRPRRGRERLPHGCQAPGGGGRARWMVETVRDALYCGMVITYAQGFAHLQAASEAPVGVCGWRMWPRSGGAAAS